MGSRSLQELLQQAEQLASNLNGGGELPRVDRSLQQILHTGQQLWSRASAQASTANDAQAAILLGSRGVDLPHISSRLETLTTARTLQPLEAVADTDIAAFLRNERENAIITAIEDSKRRTSEEVDKLYWKQQQAEWEQKKQDLLSAFTHSGTDLLNITVQQQDSIVCVPRNVGGTSSSLSSEEMAYVRVIREYNEEVLQGGIRPNLADSLTNAASTMSDQGISDLWALVQCLSEVPVSVGGDAAQARASPRVQAALVKQARGHLEKSYATHMRRMVYSHLERAQLGGVPGLVPLVRAFLEVVLPPQVATTLEDGQANNAPVWPLIFYCMRAGGSKAACLAAAENSSPSVVEIVTALEQYEKNDSGRLPPDLEKKLRMSYKRAVKNSSDPFKRAVYCVLSRCDPHEDHNDIAATTDDYLWLKLCVVDCDTSPSASTSSSSSAQQDILSLTHLQNLLYEQYGETHFNAWNQPLLYTTILLQTGQFEAAVEFLSRKEALRCHAVHVALALHEMNLLALPAEVHAPMLSREDGDPEGVRRLNLTRLILLYTRKFEATDPCEALHYCFFLRSLKGKNGENMFAGCISQLVLNSREFDLLLGRLEPDGRRTPGIIDKFKVDVSEVTQMVAQDSEKKGLHEDAVKLYDLAKNHEKVVSLLNQLLSQVVHQTEGGSGSQRGRVVELATAVALRFKTHGHKTHPNNAATLHLLLDLTTFFDLYHKERYMDALEVLKKLRIIALSRDEVETRVAGVSAQGSEVRSVLPHVLLAAMTTTHRLYRMPVHPQTPQTSFNASTTVISPAAKHLQEQARAIVTFAGMIPMRLHSEINARLVQLEAVIN
ncbi:nuclear pore complex protein Nup93 isoform X1 [Procambarus clarkii]|uniref:nuclear pore complex protein Nup93 isoform X1 n=1 Tax=Procambarus clarkii TaxID=6728 RepID=UPI001E670B23|nr:nuclear pore complex protein Nup93-like isoform X1 [Procambarus clarkii]